MTDQRDMASEIGGLLNSDRRLPSGRLPDYRTVTRPGRRLTIGITAAGTADILGAGLPQGRIERLGTDGLVIDYDGIVEGGRLRLTFKDAKWVSSTHVIATMVSEEWEALADAEPS